MSDLFAPLFNVLSLFDGMSCGQIALNRVGIPYDKYFASEIDKNAIKVTQHNYPDTIQVGDVTKVSSATLPRISLLMGGSPCQGFSSLGDQLNFDDPRSALFFEFVRLKNELQPEYFLLENVKMKNEHRDVITRLMGVEPIMINSSDFCAQQRSRLYWTNIPLENWKPKVTNVNDILEDLDEPATDSWHKWFVKSEEKQLSKGYSRVVNDHTKAICQTARQFACWNGNLVRLTSGKYRFLTPVECERLQTVPDGYTAPVSRMERYKMLGNGWTVDVIAHILKGMPTNG